MEILELTEKLSELEKQYNQAKGKTASLKAECIKIRKEITDKVKQSPEAQELLNSLPEAPERKETKEIKKIKKMKQNKEELSLKDLNDIFFKDLEHQSPEYQDYMEKYFLINQKIEEMCHNTISRSRKYKSADKKYSEALNEKIEIQKQIMNTKEIIYLQRFDNDPDKIVDDAIAKAQDMLEKFRKSFNETGAKLDKSVCIKMLANLVFIHLEILKDDEARRNSINQTILKMIDNCDDFIQDDLSKAEENTEKNNNLAEREVQTRPITEVQYTVDKVSRNSFNPSTSLSLLTLNTVAQIRNKSKEKILATLSLRIDDEFNELSIEKGLDGFDREVHDVVTSLYVKGGNQCITPRMIFRAMTGNSQAQISAKQKKEIEESLEKMNRTIIELEISPDEQKDYGLEVKYKGRLLDFRTVTVKNNGNKTVGYEILAEPILYQYANQKKQVDSISTKYLNTPIPKSRENLILQSYIQRRILDMKSGNVSRNILYSTIYDNVIKTKENASEESIKKKKQRIRKSILEIMNYWKSSGFIKDFTENTKGKQYYSITIILHK